MFERFILKGDLCYSKNPQEFEIIQNGYLVCQDGYSKGVYKNLPQEFAHWLLIDYSGKLIIPGMIDLHTHAPQYSFCGLGMNMELLNWLNAYTFPEEAKYSNLDYAEKAYDFFVKDLLYSPNTRACIFSTVHSEATVLLMDKLERTGLVTMVGKVNMDRNSPDDLQEESAQKSFEETIMWLERIKGRYCNTHPILSPRFIPSCSDELMRKIKLIQEDYNLPVQSHLSENLGEVAWVSELCPDAAFYGDAYDQFMLFGNGTPTVMAHCVWSNDDELERIKKNNVIIAHCPQSNANLSSGIAPIRKCLNMGISVGLGSDVAAGAHLSIFRAIVDAVQMSKLRWSLVDSKDKPLTIQEAFYLATIGGGSFFGKIGSFEVGYELDAVIIDDSSFLSPFEMTIEDRVVRSIYLSGNHHIAQKYVKGQQVIPEKSTHGN